MSKEREEDTYRDREKLIREEMERQRKIYREGTSENTLRRAAINALMDKGEW